MSNLKRNGVRRWAPSYLRNRGKITKAQKRALRDWWDEFGIRFEHDRILNLDEFFLPRGPLVIEIGFGKGNHLIGMASRHPDHRFLGIEVHRPGLAHATALAKEKHCRNLRLIRGDARLVFTDHLEAGIASAVMIQFPDPWPKPSDQHRRLVQPGMADAIHRILEPEGQLLVVTDVAGYAEHTNRILDRVQGWRRRENSPWFRERVETLYEAKALEAGREIHELAFERS